MWSYPSLSFYLSIYLSIYLCHLCVPIPRYLPLLRPYITFIIFVLTIFLVAFISAPRIFLIYLYNFIDKFKENQITKNANFILYSLQFTSFTVQGKYFSVKELSNCGYILPKPVYPHDKNYICFYFNKSSIQCVLYREGLLLDVCWRKINRAGSFRYSTDTYYITCIYPYTHLLKRNGALLQASCREGEKNT